MKKERKKNIYHPPQELIQKKTGKHKGEAGIYKIQDIDHNTNLGQRGDIFTLDSINTLINEDHLLGTDEISVKRDTVHTVTAKPAKQKELTDIDFEQILKETIVSESDSDSNLLDITLAGEELVVGLDWEEQPASNEDRRMEGSEKGKHKKASDQKTGTQPGLPSLPVAGLGFVVVCLIIAAVYFIIKVMF